MLDEVLSSVADELDDYLSNRFGDGDKVLISPLAKVDGSIAVTETDKVVLSLINIQEERVGNNFKYLGGAYPPIKLILHLLFSSVFEEKNYLEGVKYLSGVISYFQDNRVLTHHNTPGLPHEIERLNFEIYNQDLQNQSHLWGAIGAKYQTSVLYRVRLITIDEGSLHGAIPYSGFINEQG